MHYRHFLLTALVSLIVLTLFSGCSSTPKSTEPTIEPLAVNMPSDEEADAATVEEQDDSGGVERDLLSQEEVENSLQIVEDQVHDEAMLLRNDGRRLIKEGNLEEARRALDGALNTILGSGLALDAHPKLAELFKEVTREVVQVEDLIAELNDEVEEEPTLVDELEEVDIDDKAVEETKEVEPAVTFDLPVVRNERVDYFINLFTNTKKKSEIAAGIQRSGQFIERFREILREEGVPEDLVYLAMIESTYKVRAYSRARAKGIWQFMSWTGKRYGLRIDWWVDERSDPYLACRAAARYLKELHGTFDDWLLAMAAYNGGPGRVRGAIRRVGSTDFWEISSRSRYLRRETRNFVPSILAAAIIMKQPEKYGFEGVVLDDPWEFKEVTIDDPIDLRIVADMAGTSSDRLMELNPALRRTITPQGYSNFTLRVPVSAPDDLTEQIAALPLKERLKYQEHFVRRGETLGGIARRYGSSVASIQQANNIRNPRRIKPGQHLIIPLSPGSPGSAGLSTANMRIQAAKGEKMTHVVRRGESLYSIARSYGTTVGSIAAWNDLNPRRPIHPGNRLTVYAYTSAPGTANVVQANGERIVYQVQQGDTLYDIAIRYNVSVNKLKGWNNLRRNLIKPGDRLTIYVSDANSN